jgi:hypothetical protein
MMRAEFTDEEAETLKESLESYLSELRVTVSTTDSISLQNAEELTHKEHVVRDLIERVGRVAA